MPQKEQASAPYRTFQQAGYKVEVSADKDGKTVYLILGVSKKAAANKSRRGRS